MSGLTEQRNGAQAAISAGCLLPALLEIVFRRGCVQRNCRTHLFSQDGQNTSHFIHQFPKLNLAAHVQPIIHTAMRGEPTASPDFQWEDKFHGYTEPF
ncbi:hypothetical protein NC651_014648 [Populus alba x Populus x berolinensis]|nr:hypothetical protein NC651_014648 [Populus alba x Populus x berolinensis]